MARVEFEHVVKRFGGTDAISDLTVTIDEGVILGLLGPNGSGKSTMLKLISGLYRPDSGRVSIDGEQPSPKTKAKVSYLPEIDHLYSWMSVAGVLEYVGAFYRDWQPKRAAELLEFMGLQPKAKVGKLSKGMRARLKIVVAMSREAGIILLDEPLSGIDPPSRSKVLKAIVSEFRVGSQTIVMSTHDVVETEALFERVIFLKDGTVALSGEAERLREERGTSIRDLFEEVYA